MKKYTSPEVTEFGSLAQLTAAIGGGGQDDQSDWPEEFPPDQGSFDVCDNTNPDSVC